MGSGFDDWVYFGTSSTVRVNYNGSHIEPLLNSLPDKLRLLSDECSAKNLSEESLTALSGRMRDSSDRRHSLVIVKCQ
jgi:hypothetical protein